MADLLTVEQAVKKYGSHRTKLEQAIEDSKLEPVHTMPYGQGTMKLYDEAALAALCKPKEPARKDAVVVQHVDLGPTNERLEELTLQVMEVLEVVTQVAAQNASLLRAIEKIPVQTRDLLEAKKA